MPELAPLAPPAPPTPQSRAASRRPPPAEGLRFLIVYSITFRVVASYLWLKLQSKFRSPSAVHELSRTTHLENARRIERGIARLQGLFIKVGQLISIMTNFLPEEFRAELAGLQDQVPARPYEDIEARFREEFDGRGPRELFAEFDVEPVASASIGQVHRARTHQGDQVAVKVQYPDIEDIVRVDLVALRRIFDVMSYFLPYHGLHDIYREIRAMILQELDFRREADHVDRIAKNFAGRADIGFPTVVRELSTTRILTTKWIDGVKASDKTRLAEQGIDLPRLARTIVQAYCQQVFVDGIYHADPHPGNLLVQPGGRVVFVDFGAVAEVPPAMRRGIVELLQAALARDTARVIQAMKDMGFIARGADPAIFEAVVDYLHQKFQEEVQLDSFSLKDVKFDPQRGLERLADLRRMDVSLRDLAEHFHIPKEWIMLERAALLLMGLCTELDPEFNPTEVIRPYLEQFVLGGEGNWQAFALQTTKELVLSAIALPGDLRKFTSRALRGELEIRFRGFEEHARLVYAAGHQLIYTMVGVTAAVFWLVLDGRGQAEAATISAWTAGGAGAVLLMSFAANRRRRRR